MFWNEYSVTQLPLDEDVSFVMVFNRRFITLEVIRWKMQGIL